MSTKRSQLYTEDELHDVELSALPDLFRRAAELGVIDFNADGTVSIPENLAGLIMEVLEEGYAYGRLHAAIKSLERSGDATVERLPNGETLITLTAQGHAKAKRSGK